MRVSGGEERWGWLAWLLLVQLVLHATIASGEIWEEDEKEVLIRSERGAKNSKDPCRYEKGPWSECDPKTNMRTRTLTLKKKATDGGQGGTGASSSSGTSQPVCEPTKTIQKKCKKACRYEKGTWSACNAQNEMVRTDTIKEKSDPSCEQKRLSTKKCKNKGGRGNKNGGSGGQGGNGGGKGGSSARPLDEEDLLSEEESTTSSSFF